MKDIWSTEELIRKIDEPLFVSRAKPPKISLSFSALKLLADWEYGRGFTAAQEVGRKQILLLVERLLSKEDAMAGKQSDLMDIRDVLRVIQHVLMDMNMLTAIGLRDRGVTSGDQRLTPNEKEFVDSILSWKRFGGSEET